MLRLLPAILLLSAIASAPGRAQTSEQCFLGRTASRYGTATRIQGNAGTNDPGGQLQLGRKTNAAGGVLSADSVQLGPGSRVAAVAANSLGKKKATIAQEGPATLPLVEPFCPVPAFACGGQDVSVAKNKTMELAPGAYGAVTLQNGADLVLGAGTYELCALRGGKKATIAAGPSTVLNVQGTLVLGNGSQLGSAGGGPFVVNVGGGTVKLGAKSKVTAVLSAPGAALDVGAKGQWRGGFCAANVKGGSRVRLDCAAPPRATTTTTTSPTTTSTVTTSSTTSTSITVAPTTTTTMAPAGCSNGDVEDGEECDDGNQDDTDGCTTSSTTCGNREITSPETCDDGNLVDEDFCPSDCKVDFCQPTANEITALVTLSTPDVAALTVFIDYPEGQVNLQGVGGDIPPGILMGPGTATTQGFDFDHALRIVAFDVFNFGTTTMATVKFNGCQGSPAPQAQDFTCRLEGNATDENFAVVPGVTCSVTLP